MASLMEYKCPNCGGKIEFNVASGNLKCPFCGTEYKLEDLKAYEEVISEQTEDSINWDTNGQTTFDYDNLNVYYNCLTRISIFSLVLIALSFMFIRRKKYDSI